MAESKKLQLIRLAYANADYQRTQELAEQLIQEPSDNSEDSVGWIYKGLSAACLSRPAKQRLQEACSYFKHAESLGTSNKALIDGAIQLSKAALKHAIALNEYYTRTSQSQVKGQHGKVVERPYEGSAEYAGRLIGQTLFDMVADSGRRRKVSLDLGKHFESSHSNALIDTLEYAFRLTSGAPEVAQDISHTIEAVIGISAITPISRRKFRNAIDPLVNELWSLYPETSIHFLKDPENIACPNCGYETAYRERGCLLGLLMGDDGPLEKASPGTELHCSLCGHRWIYSGKNKL